MIGNCFQIFEFLFNRQVKALEAQTDSRERQKGGIAGPARRGNRKQRDRLSDQGV
jgi:hypothetical protein